MQACCRHLLRRHGDKSNLSGLASAECSALQILIKWDIECGYSQAMQQCRGVKKQANEVNSHNEKMMDVLKGP